MKAIAVPPGQHTIDLVDHPEPLLSAPSDVKLRMLEVGVCGTDKEICAFQYGIPPSGSDSLVIGHESLAFDVMRVLGTNGIFVFTGVPGRKAPMPVDTDLLMRNLVLKNQVVFGTVNANRGAFEASIRDLGIFHKKWPTALRSMITGHNPMDAYRDLLIGKPRGIKEVISIG